MENWQIAPYHTHILKMTFHMESENFSYVTWETSTQKFDVPLFFCSQIPSLHDA